MRASVHETNTIVASICAGAIGLALYLIQQDLRSGALVLLWGALLLSLLACALTWRRRSAIDDTPTSRIASAAQGYVELVGRGRQMAGQTVLSPLTHLPCLWYSYSVLEVTEDGWLTKPLSRAHESGTSDANFLLVDASGECVIDPTGAEIHTSRRQSWRIGNLLYEESLLLIEDTLYALGHFTSVRPGEYQRTPRHDISATLTEWKQNRSQLLRRFDSNADGEIDEEEWERVRQAAEREVHDNYRREDALPGYKRLARPPVSQRPFIIANSDPARLSRRFRLWSHVHLGLCLASLAGLIWLVTH